MAADYGCYLHSTIYSALCEKQGHAAH